MDTNNQKQHSRESGQTLLEMITVLLILSLMIGMALPDLKSLDSPLRSGSQGMLGFFKQARAKAISSTSAYIIAPASATRISTSYANTCNAASRTTDSSLTYDLPNGAQFSSTTWSVCYNSRGLSDTNVQVTVIDDNSQSKTLEVFLGGAVRINP